MFICTRESSPRNKSAMASDIQLRVKKKMSTNHYMKPLPLHNEGFALSNAKLNETDNATRLLKEMTLPPQGSEIKKDIRTL
jgi:hypothetical protein